MGGLLLFVCVFVTAFVTTEAAWVVAIVEPAEEESCECSDDINMVQTGQSRTETVTVLNELKREKTDETTDKNAAVPKTTAPTPDLTLASQPQSAQAARASSPSPVELLPSEDAGSSLWGQESLSDDSNISPDKAVLADDDDQLLVGNGTACNCKRGKGHKPRRSVVCNKPLNQHGVHNYDPMCQRVSVHGLSVYDRDGGSAVGSESEVSGGWTGKPSSDPHVMFKLTIDSTKDLLQTSADWRTRNEKLLVQAVAEVLGVAEKTVMITCVTVNPVAVSVELTGCKGKDVENTVKLVMHVVDTGRLTSIMGNLGMMGSVSLMSMDLVPTLEDPSASPGNARCPENDEGGGGSLLSRGMELIEDRRHSKEKKNHPLRVPALGRPKLMGVGGGHVETPDSLGGLPQGGEANAALHNANYASPKSLSDMTHPHLMKELRRIKQRLKEIDAEEEILVRHIQELKDQENMPLVIPDYVVVTKRSARHRPMRAEKAQ